MNESPNTNATVTQPQSPTQCSQDRSTPPIDPTSTEARQFVSVIARMVALRHYTARKQD
jgi:hypothetical protein